MSKCMASQDGIFRNVYAFGTKCEGHSTQCKLKSSYDSIEKLVKNVEKVFKNSMGIVGDSEEY